VTPPAQECRRPLAFRFRSGDEEAHALIRRRRNPGSPAPSVRAQHRRQESRHPGWLPGVRSRASHCRRGAGSCHETRCCRLDPAHDRQSACGRSRPARPGNARSVRSGRQGFGMVNLGQQVAGAPIGLAHLDADRTLADRRRNASTSSTAVARLHVRAASAGKCQQGRIHHAVIELFLSACPRCRGMSPPRCPAQTLNHGLAGNDAVPTTAPCGRPASEWPAADEGVPYIFAGQARCEFQPAAAQSHVLAGMHREIDRLVEERCSISLVTSLSRLLPTADGPG